MRRKGRLTRRQRALRALAVLVFLVLYVVLPGRYYFVPSQAIRAAERLGNIGSTQLIYKFPEEGRTLRGNDRGLMACTLQNDVADQGWEAKYCAFLDCTKPAPFHVGFCRSLYGADWYGRIDDPAAAAVRLEYYTFNLGERQLKETFVIEKEDWIEQGGRLYFALEFEIRNWPLFNFAHSELLDSEGNIIDSQEIFVDHFSDVGRPGKALYQ